MKRLISFSKATYFPMTGILLTCISAIFLINIFQNFVALIVITFLSTVLLSNHCAKIGVAYFQHKK